MRILMNDTPEKKKFREETLPKQPLTHTILVPAIRELLQDSLLQTLRAEIEIYKAFPKNNAKPDLKAFNPTNPKTCFMGQGFGQKHSGWSDADLDIYRKRIGTINHPIWGNCTLLEIWGADHYQSDNDMVVGVFKYCYGMRKTLPILKFNSIPFILTELTGKLTMREEDKEQAMDEYFTNANVIRASRFDMKPYKDWDSMPDEVKQNFEEQWKNRSK